MDGLTAIWQGLDWSMLLNMLLSVIPILFCLTIHELAHGAVAYALGDDTAKRAGRLTLNPIRHIDPMGFLMMLVARFGWAKAVPVDMRNFKRPKAGMAITALAGPMSNFLLAALIFLFQIPIVRLLQGDGIGFIVGDLLRLTGMISIFLGVFNLLPIPPLDGSKVLFSLLPDRHYLWLMRYERYGFFLLLLLMFFGMREDGAIRTFMNSAVTWFIEITAGPSAFLFG
ncbi:MAG: site-2 protease family protein [Oscillospiraceae bacterium]|nr:site-2 protease family protein [Oscillospiraceae bacterium]